MPRTPRPTNASAFGRAGMRALADAVHSALRGQLTPVFAGGTHGPTGRPLVMLSEARVSSGAGAHAATDTATLTSATIDPATVEFDQIDELHQETWQLVHAAQAGNGEAFGKLYDRYVDIVYRYIYFRVNDRGLAEDFTSETFLRALRRIGTITYQGRDIGAWFVTIARNIVFDHTKSARTRLEFSTGDVLDSGDTEPGPEVAVLDALASAKLRDGIRQLNDDQRECVVLRFIQGLSVSETAAAMGKNDGAIKALQHRAVRKLADLVGEELR
jgi:RNA polymerase sigma-70 factor (ECF subfamily)